MCDVCCKEFRGWCKSFTKTELFLSVLEFVLLVIFAVLLGFIILHFLVCSEKASVYEYGPTLPYKPGDANANYIPDETEISTSATSTLKSVTIASPVQCTWKESEKTEAATHYYEKDKINTSTTSITSIMAECTWKESEKTEAATHYYEKDKINTTSTTVIMVNITSVTSQELIDFSLDLSDEEDALDAYKEIVLALVKIRPSQNITFACILVKITKYWTLSAASCIEKTDSINTFVMMEGYGDLRQGRTHAVADVRIHPLYNSTNRSYDVVALRSKDSLDESSVTLPTTLDYYFATIGESLTVLGYGPYRSEDPRAARALRATSVWRAAAERCGGGGGGGVATLCGVPRAGRVQPCYYSGGSPLLAGRRLLAVMSDKPCDGACEPALFVNVAAPFVRRWLHAVVAG